MKTADVARRIIAAVVAVTAVDHEGLVVCEFDDEGNPLSGRPAAEVAASQIVEVLRWLVAHPAVYFAPAGHAGWTTTGLADLAREIEERAL